MQELHLTDLIDVNILQKMQDTLSAYTRMAALITDERGIPVTQGSGFTRLCMEMTRKSELGCRRCEECDKRGALLTLLEGKPTVYDCHAGLIDYAAPIMADGYMVGSFIGGQVRVTPMDEEATRAVARELGLDEDEYVAEARNIQQLSREEVEKAAAFLTDMASIISEVAYHNYQALQKSRRLEHITQAQNELIINMNAEMQKTMLDLSQKGYRALTGQNQVEMEEVLQQLLKFGEEMSASIHNTMEYASISGGEAELNEEVYALSELLENVRQMNTSLLNEQDCQLDIEIDESVPGCLYGDSNRLAQLLGRMVQYVAGQSRGETIRITADCQKTTYAVELRICLQYHQVLPEPEVERLNRSLANTNLRVVEKMPGEKVGLIIGGYLVQQMSGTAEIRSNSEAGTVYELKIPQLYIG